ncbi:PepSY domain-containing protein [Parashewanella tropica]|uniref:PepSY domain-containing protein n=1 Tax=Parashewanella tropica TaxID=2547970 RepID=UPI00105A9700|nr:PepSY domain-containing protein [Parashewanella tropica]
MKTKIARRYHKWLMILVGIQFVIWSITGVYMVSLDIHYIHGESLQETEPYDIQTQDVRYSINDLLRQYPKAKEIELRPVLGKLVYQLTLLAPTRHSILVDAETGKILSKVDQQQAINIAESAYRYSHPIKDVKLLSERSQIPSELSPRYLPVWQIKFDHFSSPTFYISQQTGKIVTKRHSYWRIFDWMWRFHIMDYDDGGNVSNWFLLLVTTLGMLAALTGAVLTYHRLLKSKKVRL